MRFSIYVLRSDPDYAIFDRQLADPPIAPIDEYDCAGVFECEDPGARCYWRQDASCHLGVVDEWMLGAEAILRGEFTDKDSGNTAKITQLWPSSKSIDDILGHTIRA